MRVLSMTSTWFSFSKQSPLLLAGLCLVLSSCAPSISLNEDPAFFEATIQRLERDLRSDPNNVEARRDLGVIQLRTGNPVAAETNLVTALARDPNDARTLFYLGLAKETQGQQQEALDLYQQYPNVSRLSRYRRLMAGRYEWMVRDIARAEIRTQIQQEAQLQAQGQQLCPDPVDSRFLAVYPFTYQGQDQQYASLGRGMAELISIDLTNVGQLTLVERARVQDLINEIQLAQGDQFDPATAPRVGCLIGAGRLFGGVYDVLGNDLRMDTRLWETETALILDVESQSGPLDNFFAVQKNVVFGLLDQMGIQLTPAERQRIQDAIATQSLQAFLAYSRGLELEDQGDFRGAAQLYNQALQFDPNFQEASDRADAVTGMMTVSGPANIALAAALAGDPTNAMGVGVDPLTRRLQVLSQSIGSNFVPGEEAREGAGELGTGGVLGTLPDPPPPPNGGN